MNALDILHRAYMRCGSMAGMLMLLRVMARIRHAS